MCKKYYIWHFKYTNLNAKFIEAVHSQQSLEERIDRKQNRLRPMGRLKTFFQTQK